MCKKSCQCDIISRIDPKSVMSFFFQFFIFWLAERFSHSWSQQTVWWMSLRFVIVQISVCDVFDICILYPQPKWLCFCCLVWMPCWWWQINMFVALTRSNKKCYHYYITSYYCHCCHHAPPISTNGLFSGLEHIKTRRWGVARQCDEVYHECVLDVSMLEFARCALTWGTFSAFRFFAFFCSKPSWHGCVFLELHVSFYL